MALCLVMAQDRKRVDVEDEKEAEAEYGAAAGSEMGLEQAVALGASAARAAERQARKKAERYTYLVAAVLSSFGITSMAAAAVYYRFSWQMEVGSLPSTETPSQSRPAYSAVSPICSLHAIWPSLHISFHQIEEEVSQVSSMWLPASNLFWFVVVD